MKNQKLLMALLASNILLMALMLLQGTSLTAWATQLDRADRATVRGYSTQGTAVEASDTVTNSGLYDGTNWIRLHSAHLGGGGTGFDCATDALSTTQESASDAVATGFSSISVYNRDNTIIIYCGDSAADVTSAGANGRQIDPRTGYTFRTSEAVHCVSASGTPTVDVCGIYP